MTCKGVRRRLDGKLVCERLDYEEARRRRGFQGPRPKNNIFFIWERRKIITRKWYGGTAYVEQHVDLFFQDDENVEGEELIRRLCSELGIAVARREAMNGGNGGADL